MYQYMIWLALIISIIKMLEANFAMTANMELTVWRIDRQASERGKKGVVRKN